MRLKPTFKKTLISLIIGIFLSVILLVLTFFIYETSIVALVAIFLVSSALSYLIWSMFQPEFEEGEDEGGDYESMYDAVEDSDSEREYQDAKLS